LGLAEQEIAIGGVSLLNFQQSQTLAALPQTRMTYKGREEDAPWRQAAADRIKANRMADLEIRVLDAQGKPLLGQTVQVRMQRHAFDFGSAVVAKRLCGSDGDSRRYQEFVERNLNKVTFEYDLKPGNWQENTPQRYMQSDLACAFDWLKKRNIKVRGHYAVQAALYDQEKSVYRSNPAGFVAGIRAHIDEKLPLIGNRVSEWDAINHLVGWGSTIADAQGTGVYADLMRQIRSAAPLGLSLWVNEAQILAGGNLRDAYEQAIHGLQQNGATPDGIGFMGHFGEMSLTGPAELYETMNRFAKLVPKLQITELDIDTADDALQADYLRDVMTVAFSHPAMQGIVLWGFWERQHWKPRAAPIRSNWNERQAMAVWRDLVFKQWWTDEKGISSSDGSYRVRGYLGEYEIQVGSGARKVILHRALQPGINRIDIRLD
jgi:GH35 family endo-1,4-beta-xylanase